MNIAASDVHLNSDIRQSMRAILATHEKAFILFEEMS